MGLDVARGLAVLGMVGAHLGDPPTLVWHEPSTWTGLVEGRSSLLFAMLAGVSISLVSRGSRQVDEARLQLWFVRRGIAILGLGLVLELLNTGVAVILPVYGLLFVVAILFLRWSTRRLCLTAAVLALLGPAAVALCHALTLEASGPGLDLTLFGVYPVTVWLAVLMTGMVIGRARLDAPRTAATLLCGGVVLAALGYTAGFAVNHSGEVGDFDRHRQANVRAGVDVDMSAMLCQVEGSWVQICYPRGYSPADALEESRASDGQPRYVEQLRRDGELGQLGRTIMQFAPHTGGTPEVIGSGGFAMAVLGACLLLTGRRSRFVLLPVAALGSMPLTAYAGHLVFIVVLARGPVGGYDGTNVLWGWTSLGMLVVATTIVATRGRGPLEQWLGRFSEPRA